MLVTCENCKSKFNLDDNLVKESGSKVRCSNCQNIFTVYHSDPEEAVVPDSGIEEQMEAMETSDELADEPLDFDLFQSEEEQDDEELSLEDFGLEEELSSDLEEPESAEELAVAEDEEITAEELGFGDGEAPEQEAVADEPEQEEISVKGLDLEDEPSTKVALSPDDEAVSDDNEAEEEMPFDDLVLEEESVVEDVAAPDGPEATGDTEEDLSFGDLDLEEEAVLEETAGAEEAFPVEQENADGLAFDEGVGLEEELLDQDVTEHMTVEEHSVEGSADAEVSMPEGVPVASLEEGEEPEEVSLEDIPSAPVIEAAAARKGISMPLLICLVVVLLGGGAYGAFTFLNGDGMKLPFLESLAGSGLADKADSGNLQISLLDNGIKGRFVENRTLGRLFVVNGEVKSSYPEARNFIRMKGVVYFRDGKVAKDRIVYCGNVLSEAELQTLDEEAIKKRLGNRFGDNKANFRVPSGKALPFMVVFTELPKDLGEFSVEVVDSVPG
jgi:predicted Zn finger-like uncharacterized protein